MISRKIAAVGAVMALVGLSVVTGSMAAYAAIPAPPTINQTFSPWTTSYDQPTLQGNKDIDVTQVDVYLSNDVVSNVPYCTMTDTPGGTGWFGCAPTSASLALGDNYLAATATNVDGTSVLGPSILITLVNPPTITSPADDIYTNDNMPTFAGTAEGSYFTVFTTDESFTFCDGTVVNLSWNCEASPALPDGDYEYMVSTSYSATEVFSTSRFIHIDTVAPAAPVIDAMVTPVDSSPGAPVSGSAEENATIDLLVDGVSVPCNTGPIDYTGYWSCNLPDGLPAGPHTLTAFQTDLAGNISPLSVGESFTVTDNTPPAAPIVTSPIGDIFAGMNLVVTNDTNPTVYGTGEPGATLDVVGNTCMIVPTIVDGSGNWSCQLTTPMTPDGDYDVHFGQTDAALNSSPLTSPFVRFSLDTVAPTYFELWTPTGTTSGGVTTATTSNPHPFISGNGEGSARIYIYRNGSIPVPCDEGPQYAGEGGFGCTVAPALSPGTYNFGFTQVDSAGNSSGSPVVYLRLTVLAPPAPPAPPPAPQPTVGILWSLAFTSDNDAPTPGQNVVLTGSSLPAGATVVGELHSDPVPLGTTVVKDDGTFTLNTHIPNTVAPGDHHYVVTVSPLDGEPQTVESPVTVMAAPESVIPPPPAVTDKDLPPLDPGGSGVTAATADRTEPAAPSTLSQSLPTLQDIITNPVVLAAAAGSSLALLFLVALPAELLNSTLDENYQRLFGRIRKPKLPWLDRVRNRLKRTPVVGGLALTTLAALILSFSDPRFGFDLTSLRLFLACAIGMFVLGWIANVITSAILQRRWSIASVIELQPFGLLVALAGVVLSRLLDFAPGLLIGLVLGLSLSASAKLRDEARYVLTWAGAILGLSIVGWLGYSFFSGIVAPGTFGGALVDDTFVAVATEGISGLVIGLLPIGFLDGRSLYRHSRWQWLGTYLVALVAFFAVVVPSGALWGDIQGPFWIWLAVLLAFAALCVGVYLWFRAHPEPEDDTDASDGIAESAAGREAATTDHREHETVSR
ncbi:hypothetical protein GCM10022239_13440 [Leifsonia bigeumensis]|uniref:Bacterial Ig-like domain-containing protein n=1 Tax=Leifsonella bigeumensis TaxID=433643 RepID=A0ABP7FJP1_9MICO